MKKIIFLFIFSLFFVSVNAEDIEDNSIIDELNSTNTESVDVSTFSLKSFDSCNWLEQELNNFFKNYNYWYPRTWISIMPMAIDSVESDSVASESKTVSNDYSETNEQVEWVSESEIIKTDGRYIYYMRDYYDYNQTDYKNRQNKNIFIVDSVDMKIVKKINLPTHFYGTTLYLQDDKLVVLASGYPSGKFQKQIWDNSIKTYTIIYDVENPSEAYMEKIYLTEWSYSESRLIDDKLYVISRKDLYSTYNIYAKNGEISAEDFVPKWLEITYTNSDNEKNIVIDWVERDYKYETGFVSNCESINYVLPSDEQNLWNPSINMVSIIDINDKDKHVVTKVVFWNFSEIYMSKDNLYITNNVYRINSYKCPFWAMCIMPFYYGWTNNTLIHKMELVEEDLLYKKSALLEWLPLTQYSMDEYDWDFRILTQTNRWNQDWEESHTDLYILDENLELKSSLENLWEWEDFKSSRFMWEKLFLVTFEQIDPFFVIDLSDDENPTILWELKMPGYSTYLHPYDENHIIGLGYDTMENKYWNIQNSGIKIDLYEIDYDRKPESKDNSWDIYVAQKYTKTFGWYGSYSDALYNPRMFMWNSNEKDLFLPVELRVADENYDYLDYFSGLLSINIDKNKWISENYKVSHIDYDKVESDWKSECAKYSQKEEETCSNLIDWSTYCKPKTYTYVPNYCYEGSTVNTYLANKSWTYEWYKVDRAIWIWDKVYSISPKLIKKSEIDSWEFTSQTTLR